jgi:predicted PurR-regulated permease PerM
MVAIICDYKWFDVLFQTTNFNLLMSILKQAVSFPVRIASILISVIAVGFLAIVGKELIIPLVFALLLSILLLPLAKLFEKKMKLPRGAASGVAVILFVTGLVIVFYTIGAQISNLSKDWPLFQQQVQTSLNNLQKWIAFKFNYNIQKQKDYINTAASGALSGSPSMVGNTLLSVTSMLIFIVLTLIYTFFMLLYRATLLKFLIALVNEKHGTTVNDVVSDIQVVIRKYILGLLLEMFIVAALCWISFGILGIKYFILLGLITALFNLVPYVGIFTALVLSALITFATTGASTQLLFVIITIICIHLIDSNILLPFIVGSKVSINALITVAGVVAGEMIWGLPGMFLSVPLIAMAKIICDRVEPLQPWAILLGHEKKERKVLKFPRKRKIQPPVTEEV